MMHSVAGQRSVTRAGLVAVVHFLAWPYAVVAIFAAVIVLGYRLLAERVRRRTLIDLVTRAPSGTIVIMESGPGGPAVWIRVGDVCWVLPQAEAWRGRG